MSVTNSWFLWLLIPDQCHQRESTVRFCLPDHGYDARSRRFDNGPNRSMLLHFYLPSRGILRNNRKEWADLPQLLRAPWNTGLHGMVNLYDMLKYAAADFYKLSEEFSTFALNPQILQKPSNLEQLQEPLVSFTNTARTWIYRSHPNRSGPLWVLFKVMMLIGCAGVSWNCSSAFTMNCKTKFASAYQRKKSPFARTLRLRYDSRPFSILVDHLLRPRRLPEIKPQWHSHGELQVRYIAGKSNSKAKVIILPGIYT